MQPTETLRHLSLSIQSVELTMVVHTLPTNSSVSVLIVDDNPTHLQVYAWIVESAGYAALLAPVTFDGVRLPEKPSDLVLLDYHLGGR